MLALLGLRNLSNGDLGINQATLGSAIRWMNARAGGPYEKGG